MSSHIQDKHSHRYVRTGYLMFGGSIIVLAGLAGVGTNFGWLNFYLFLIGLSVCTYGWWWLSWLNKTVNTTLGNGVVTGVESYGKVLHKITLSLSTQNMSTTVWTWTVKPPSKGSLVKLGGNLKHWVIIPYNERNTYWPAWKTPTPKTIPTNSTK